MACNQHVRAGPRTKAQQMIRVGAGMSLRGILGQSEKTYRTALSLETPIAWRIFGMFSPTIPKLRL